MKPFSLSFVCVFAFCLLIPSTSSFAQKETKAEQKKSKPKSDAGNKNKKDNKEKVPQLTKERKETLLSFVDFNHPELKGLLSELEKRKKQRQYHLAMAGLDKSVKKLEGIKKRNPKRYESALAQWNLESRIKVASAQVKLNDTDESRDKLESLVTQLIDFHIDRMKKDREQVLARLETMDKRIAEAESNREQAIEKRVKSVTRKKGKKEKKKE